LSSTDWPSEIHREFSAADVRLVGYVPDAGHKHLIEHCRADAGMQTVVLTSEEEGIGLAAGAWLGGKRTVLLMQSSGIGNIVNTMSMVRECRFPLVNIVTMRGEQGEFNPWQVPMGQAAGVVLETMGTIVYTADSADQIVPMVRAALGLAYESNSSTAVLIAQHVIGIKSFEASAKP